MKGSINSVEEDLGLGDLSGGGAVDVNHEVSESGGAHHHGGKSDGEGSINVGLIGINTIDEGY